MCHLPDDPGSRSWKPVLFHWYHQIEIDEGWCDFDAPVGALLNRRHPKTTCIAEDDRLAIIAAELQCPGVVLRIALDRPLACMFRMRRKDQLFSTTSHFDACVYRVGCFLDRVNCDPVVFFESAAHRVFFVDASLTEPVALGATRASKAGSSSNA